jgi:hypothetical protein
MWTSPAKTGFQAIVVHWADADSRKVETALLSLREFKGSHGGEQQARVFMEVILEFELQDHLGFFTSDNHGSNDKMLRYIAEHKSVTKFDPTLRRVRCFGHNLNIVAQAFLFGSTRSTGEDSQNENDAINMAIQEVRQLQADANNDKLTKEEIRALFRQHGALGKVHNINTWIRASTERYQDFVSTVGRAIPMDNDTRWNSWHDEVTVVLSKRRELMLWINEYFDDLSDDVLNRDDWQELEDL